MQHEIKIENHHFLSVLQGKKTAEIRKDDRNYKIGDELVFLKIDGKKLNVNRRFYVSHKLTDSTIGIQTGYCMLSLFVQ